MKFLFVRALEACNAHCKMCRFAGNHDGYCFPLQDWPILLDSALDCKVECIRLTGGEPLYHPDIIQLVAESANRGFHTSVITNGYWLSDLLSQLVDHGLNQVIVSLDSAYAHEHDSWRGLSGLFARLCEGLQLAKRLGVHTRISTVCGPHNFRGMPALQELLSDIGVDQWELSTLKLGGPLDYKHSDRPDLENVTHAVYYSGPTKGRPRPLGKVWWGETPSEQKEYLEHGIAPKPDSSCEVVHFVRYLDPVRRRLYPCSLLPHREKAESVSVSVPDWGALQSSFQNMNTIAEQLSRGGFRACTGCSATAAGFSLDQRVRSGPFTWDF